MSDAISELVRQVLTGESHPDGLPCRVPKCTEAADGLDGFCVPHSRERERTGRWETRRLFEAETKKGPLIEHLEEQIEEAKYEEGAAHAGRHGGSDRQDRRADR